MKKSPKSSKPEAAEIAGALDELDSAPSFPEIDLPIRPPYPPMEAKSVPLIPQGSEYLYEPKWDGFRCLAFRKGKQVFLQSKAGQPLGRYFPELVEALTRLPQPAFVLDGEIVIFRGDRLSFDDLLQRIHPAESRIQKLAQQTPCTFMCFDLLVDGVGQSRVDTPLRDRREQLESFLEHLPKGEMIRLSPASTNSAQADKWMDELATMGLDGIIAKLLDEPYRPGERTAVVKIKRVRTIDCVVGGFRYAEKGDGVGSLLLGLYNHEGLLDHVGFTSSFTREQRVELRKTVEREIGPPGFTGKAPGGPSRWSTKRSSEWQPLKLKLVVEVSYDHFSGGRFRHGAKFLRWRSDKSPQQCTFDQLQAEAPTPQVKSPKE